MTSKKAGIEGNQGQKLTHLGRMFMVFDELLDLRSQGCVVVDYLLN
ncbi:hypothetical protein [Chitinimonas taiwanensis]|nr:hypothetical protein [Chitinimonas taiwanensis]